ncbi:KH homology domain-containing protein 4 [Bienertia sinuspersici]
MDQERAKEGYGEVERVDKKKAEGDREDAQSDDNQDEAEIEWQDEGKEEEEARIELSLVGKLWTNKNINTNAFMTTIKGIWQPKHRVGISNIGKNQFIFQFYHWRDKLRVWEDQPWHFDQHALILGEVDGNSKPSDIDLHEIPMWVRIYNLPIMGRLNPNNVVNMGNKIGSFIKMDQFGCGGIDKSIRIRVSIDNMGGNPTSCAKKIFVPKPRREEEKVVKEQICEMANRLGGVLINATQEEIPTATVDINGENSHHSPMRKEDSERDTLQPLTSNGAISVLKPQTGESSIEEEQRKERSGLVYQGM